MRLQLILLLGAARALHAEPADAPGATGGLHVYADDDHVTVISPSATVRADLSPRVAITADTTADVISAASVDVVTSASPSEVHEQRLELGLAGTYRPNPTGSWTVGVRGSHEHDYDAWRVRASVRSELAHRNTTLGADYVLGYDEATSAMDATFHDDRLSHELIATASQLVSPRAIVDVVADATRARGYHASPYREVLIDVPGSPLPMHLAEVTPRLRTGLAIAVRGRYALSARWAASAMYRFYDDTWDVLSHTATAEVYHRAGRWLVGGTLRGYTQSAASFHAERYTGEPRFRTRDRTLGAMRSAYGAVTLDVSLADWHVVASAGLLRLWFLELRPQSDRNAALMFAGATRAW